MNARYQVCPQCPDRVNSDWPNGLSMPVWSYRSFPSARKFAEKEAMSYTFGLVVYDSEKRRVYDGERWVPAEDFGK